jgi:hypothetical protein
MLQISPRALIRITPTANVIKRNIQKEYRFVFNDTVERPFWRSRHRDSMIVSAACVAGRTLGAKIFGGFSAED